MCGFSESKATRGSSLPTNQHLRGRGGGGGKEPSARSRPRAQRLERRGEAGRLPSPAMHRLARGGSRHRALRLGCACCRSQQPVRPPAPSPEEQGTPSPPPPATPFCAGTRRPAARAAPWSTLSRRRNNFDSGLGLRVPLVLGSGSFSSRSGLGGARVCQAYLPCVWLFATCFQRPASGIVATGHPKKGDLLFFPFGDLGLELDKAVSKGCK